MPYYDKDSLNYKLAHAIYKYMRWQHKPLLVVCGFLALVFAILLISKSTPYYEFVRDITLYKSWFLITFAVVGAYSFIALFIGLIGIEFELYGDEEDLK